MAKNVSQSREMIRWERDSKDKENSYKHSLDFQKISSEDMGVSDITPCCDKSPEKNNAKKRFCFPPTFGENTGQGPLRIKYPLYHLPSKLGDVFLAQSLYL